MYFYLPIKKESSKRQHITIIQTEVGGIKLLFLNNWTGLGCLPLHIKDLLHILRVSSFMKEDVHAIRLSASASFRGSNDKV